MSIIVKAKLALFIAMILWASAFVGIRYAVIDYSPGALALLRYAAASVFLLLIVWKFKRPQAHNWRDILSAMVLGVFGFAIYNVCLNYGERTVTAGIASFLVGLVPIIVAIVAHWVYHERLSKFASLGFVVSFIGMLLIMIGESHGQIDVGVLWILAAAVGGAIYTVLQKSLLKRFNSIEFTAWAIWGGTLTMLIFTPEVLHDVQHASWGSTAVVIYLGIFPGVLAYICWSYGFKHLSAAHAVSFSYWLPFFSTVMGFLLLGEIPHLVALIGGIIAIGGAVIVNRSRITLPVQ